MSHPPVSAITNGPILTRQYSKARASVATFNMTEKHVFGFEMFWMVLSHARKKGGSSLVSQLMLLISNLRLILRFNLNLKNSLLMRSASQRNRHLCHPLGLTRWPLRCDGRFRSDCSLIFRQEAQLMIEMDLQWVIYSYPIGSMYGIYMLTFGVYWW